MFFFLSYVYNQIRFVILIVAISMLACCSGFRTGLHSAIALKLGAKDLDNGKYNAAIRHFDRVINNLPAESEQNAPDIIASYYYCRGLAYVKIANCPEGLQNLKKASELVEEAHKKVPSDITVLDKLASDISFARQLCNK